MARSFNVPSFYRSSGIATIKRFRQLQDPKKRDLSPTTVDFGAVRFLIARHFGFCFGVENAIEIAYRAVDENPGRKIYLLSEMIHNPQVNADLQSRGVEFLMDTDGSPRIPFERLSAEDIVIVPAFGTTVELQQRLLELGIDPYYYDTTCPFVEKVWKRSEELGRGGYTVIVHGKQSHEETRATFSHSRQTAPTIVILDMNDAELLIRFIKGEVSEEGLMARFADSVSEGFRPAEHLRRVGVVNQTTMLATETQAIANRIRETMIERYGAEKLREHFADTRDTLCYATHENQTATRNLIEAGADLAIVVGGYNSSNTSHLVELCEERMPTFYIRDAQEIISGETIRHFELATKTVRLSHGWLPEKSPVTIALTAGASCPDRTVDEVIHATVALYADARSFSDALSPYCHPPTTSPAQP